MALELAVMGGKAVASGARLAGDAAMAVGEGLADTAKEGLMRAGDTFGDFGDTVQETAGDMERGIADMGDRVAGAFRSRRMQRIELSHRFCPEWLVVCLSASGIISFFAVCGRTIFCCYWPLECCGALFAKCFNRIRRCCCPCANEFMYWTITIDRIAARHSVPSLGAGAGRPRPLEVGVRYSKLFGLGGFEAWKTVEAGQVAQPQELPPQELGGGVVHFQARLRDLPLGQGFFQPVLPASGTGTSTRHGRLPFWIAKAPFRLDSRHVVERGWALDEICALKLGQWRKIFSSAVDADHPKGPEKTPDEAIKEASSYGKTQRVQFPATVQMLEFSGMQPGAAEWPPRLVPTDRGQAAAEDAMAIEYWGVEEDLVLVLQLFLERRAVKQAKKIKRNAVATGWLESLGQRARAVRDMATSAAEDAGDMARATLRRITLIRSLVPTDPNSTFELSRTISIPIRPYHREAGSIEQAFTGDRHLLHAYTETMASNTSRGIVVHLRRCRVEVAPGRGPIRGKVKIAGFLVPREALLQAGHMQGLEPLREMSRVDVFRGDDPEWDPRGQRRGGSLRLTVPLRPNDTTVRLYLRPRLTWSESFGNLLGMLPGIGGALSGVVKWASGPKDDDGLFRGEVIFRFHPMIDGTHVSCEVAGHGQQVEVTRAEMTEPGTGIQNVEVPSPGTSDARCSYFVQLRLCASEGKPLAKPVTFPVHIAPHTFLGWLAAVIGSIVMVSGLAGLAALSEPPWCLVAKIFKAIPATLAPEYMNITAPASLFNLTGMVYECRPPEAAVDFEKLHMAVELTMSHVTKGFLMLALSLLLCCPFKLWSRRMRNPCACLCPKRLQEGRCFPFAYYSVIVLSTLTLPVWWFVAAWMVASRPPSGLGFLSLQLDDTVFRSGWMRSFFILAGSVVHFVAILLCCCFTMHEGPDGFWGAPADPLELVLPEHVADDLGLSATAMDSPANWGILETLAPISRYQAHRASAALRSTLLEVGARSSGARSRGRTHVLKKKEDGLHKALSLVARDRCGAVAWRGQGGDVFLSEVVRLAGAAPRSFVTSGEFEKAFRMLSEGPRGIRGRDGRDVAKMSRRHFAALRRWSLRDKKDDQERSTEDSLAHVWAEERLYRIPFHEAWEAADDDDEEEHPVLHEIREFFHRILGQDLPAEEAWRALFVDGPVAHLVLDWKLSTWGALEVFSKADAAIETSEDDTEAWPCNLAIGVLLRADQRLDSHPALVGATLHIDVRLRYLGREVAQLGTRDTVLCKDVDGAYGKPPKKYNLVVRARPQAWQPFDEYCVSFDIRPANEADGNWTGQWRWHMSSILSHLRVGWQLLDQNKDVERSTCSRRKCQAAAAAAACSSGGRASRALVRRGSLTSEMELEMGLWPGPGAATSSVWEEPVEDDWLDAVQQHPYPRGEAEAKLLRWFCPSCATMVPVWWPVSDYQLVLDLLGDKREKNPQYDLLGVDITDIIHSFQERERKRLREASEIAAHHPMVEQNPEMMLTLLRKLRRKARQSAAVARLLKYHVLDGRDPRARGEYGATVEGLKSLVAHVNETLDWMPSVQRKVKVKTWAAELLAETRRMQWGEDQRPLPAGPVLHRVFDVDAGWKARRTLGGKLSGRDAKPASRRPKRSKEEARPRVYKGDTPVASGWALDRMRVAVSYGLTLPDWKAREGEDAIAWLREVAKHTANITDPGLDSFADLVLEGERRIFLDADGQVHELAKSSGMLLAGTETSRPGEQEGLSAMELSRLLRQLQEKQEVALREHRKDGPDVFALTVPLRTKADVSHLQAAVSERKGPGLVELSEDGAVVPYGDRFLYVESPVLAARQEDIALFRDRLDAKGGEELLPATGTVGVTQDLLLQVPDDRGLLSLHLLLLARVHGFQLSREDAGEALCNIAGGRGEPAAELKALRCLVRGRFPHAAMFADLDLKCDRGHAMELRQAQGVMSLLLPKTFECNGCWQKITRADDYYCCSGAASPEVPEPVGKVRTAQSDRVAKKASTRAETCTFQLCTDCAYRIHEFKERLARLREEMSEAEASSDSDDPAKKKQVQKGALIAELAKEYMVDLTDADADFFAASAGGDGKAASTGFQDRLQRFMPVSEALSCCCTDPPPKMKRYSWRKWAVKTRICDWCQEKVPYTSEQYGCSNCGRTLCLACALRQKAANTPLARRGSRNFDEDGTLD